MASNTIYLITGANRGIGFGLASDLLSRVNTTVIATVRSTDTSAENLKSLATADGSKLIIAVLDSSSEKSPVALISIIQAQHKIAHIDIIIANAGVGESFLPLLNTPLSSLVTHFQVNTVGPISLFQACYPLLSKSKNAKFILISSSLGSIGNMEGPAPTLAYGASKAAANYFVRKIHFEFQGIVALAIHPGWVKTGNGQAFADSIGVEEPPMTLEESVKGVLKQVDGATRATSGTFVSFDGTPIAW